MKIFIVTLSLAILAHQAFASGDHSAPKDASRFNESSAVNAFNIEDGFKLKDTALATLGVQFQRIDGAGPWNIPKESLVQIKHATGVYRRFEGWISFVLVQTGAKKDSMISIQSEDLQAGDEVAVTGVSFLRMTEADLNSDTVDSCSH